MHLMVGIPCASECTRLPICDSGGSTVDLIGMQTLLLVHTL